MYFCILSIDNYLLFNDRMCKNCKHYCSTCKNKTVRLCHRSYAMDETIDDLPRVNSLKHISATSSTLTCVICACACMLVAYLFDNSKTWGFHSNFNSNYQQIVYSHMRS